MPTTPPGVTKRNDQRGKIIKNLIDTTNTQLIAPTSPTRFGYNSASIIDFALTRNLPWPSQNKIHRKVHAFQSKLWADDLRSLDPDDGSLWEMSEGLRKKKSPVYALNGRAGIAHTDSDKAEVLACSLESQFQDNNISSDTDYLTNRSQEKPTSRGLLFPQSQEKPTSRGLLFPHSQETLLQVLPFQTAKGAEVFWKEIEITDQTISAYQKIIRPHDIHDPIRDALAKAKKTKINLVSELRTLPPCTDPDCTDHTIISKENDSTPDNLKPNDKKKSQKRKSIKQDSEGFVFPTKSARPTTPTPVLEPIPTQNNFESLEKESEPMIDSSQENVSPIIKPPYPITLKTDKNYRDQLKKISENFLISPLKQQEITSSFFRKRKKKKKTLPNF
ncbi:hypothetical protein TNCV_1190791 [Trichonephila clavipes]|nr:hypothetical protein TNCV_1190791 [Trichonephila clavipes]